MTRIIINLIFAAVVVLPLLTVASGPTIFSIGLFEKIEQIVYDERIIGSISSSQSYEVDERIVIVDIDQESIDQIGIWPWRRDIIADFISLLLGNARMVVFQDRFSTRDNQTVSIFEDLQDRFYYDDAILAAIRRIEPEFNYDLRLLNEIDGQEVIVGFEFDTVQRQTGVLPESVELVDDNERPISGSVLRSVARNWKSYEGFLGNEEEFNKRALAVGFTNFRTDADGVIRFYDLVASNAGVRYPSLGLVALRYYDDPTLPFNFKANIGSDYSLVYGSSIDRIGVEGHQVNINRDGSMLLNFKSFGGKNRSFQYIPAHQVISGSLPPGTLDDKIVFVGSTSLVISDLWLTPVNPQMPGIEIHATALQNLLDSSALKRGHNSWIVENILLIILAGLISVFYPKLRVSISLLISIVLILGVYYINYSYFWLEHQQVYRIVPFVMVILVLTMVNLLSGFVVEYQQKRKVEGVLNQYIPPELAREVNESQGGFSMEGEIREMTILFSDVRGFTTISEQFKAHELTKLMNQMLTALSRQIHANRGTIDKYIGDAVMAFGTLRWTIPTTPPMRCVEQSACSRPYVNCQMSYRLKALLRSTWESVSIPEKAVLETWALRSGCHTR